jgi:transcriptional regulator of acetoin/glycerol metabolism
LSETVKLSDAAFPERKEEWVPLAEIEGRYVRRALEHMKGNKQATSRLLGVDRKTLDRMIKRHNIEFISMSRFPSRIASGSRHF